MTVRNWGGTGKNRDGIGAKILFYALLLGGVPPMLSGLFAVLQHDIYLSFIGNGVPGLIEGPGYGLTTVIANLQGGDAFVGGSARVLVAFLGGVLLMRLVAAIGIVHSLFEIWLLTQRLLPWCDATPSAQCGELFRVEIWGFILLHGVLVVGFTVGIYLSRCRLQTS